ncbi:MAG: prephenate dehydratase, partial [Candidatus Gracilibacteria bacterium]|nr:prephenate dehydratase [Candidatus Gracilibacteria bacterium]
APSIGIIGGNGRMGKLFADFFRERGLEVLISDLKTKISNKEVAKKSDITIISVPIDKTVEVIKEVLPCMKKGSAITDFTSIKEIPISEMMKAKSVVEVFGMHPMFGNSNPVFGQTVLICPTKKSGKWYKWMKEFLDKNGAITKVMTPKEHDQIMAIAQDLIHFVEITCADGLRLTGLPVKEILPFISKASELKVMSSARILDQDAGLYGNMQMQNPYNLKFLNNYKKTVENLIEIIGKKDLNSFKKYFAKTNKYLGEYAHEAYKDSSFLIDELIESRSRKQYKEKIEKKIFPSKNCIALLGPKDTFSDLAATKYLENCQSPDLCHSRGGGNLSQKFYTKTIEEVFELVKQGKVAKGIIPIENKLDGTIRETLDNLFTKKVHIVSSLELPIHHCLAILPFSKPADIQKIISHEQALNQSKKYLKKHFATADKEAYPSTVSAIEKLIFSNDKSLAVVVSKQAAQNYDLKITAENIEDENSNSTKFIVIEKGDYTAKKPVQKNSTEHSKNQKTSIAFHFDKDSPGSLFIVLEDFAKAKINLTKIESRPTKKEFGDYIFYLDFDGSPENPKTKEVLKTLRKKVAKFKVLGTASRTRFLEVP